ncbi:MAG TPA: thioredoxin [Actinomycetota bacterium]|nr:thioredoxin [Actinomycetota bacterium]
MALTTNVVHGRKSERLLVVMHGLGADERDLAEIVPYLDPEGRFLAVLPRAQYAESPGFAWFRLGAPAVIAGNMSSSIQSLNEVIDAACEKHGLKWEDAVVAGFSQGGCMAVALAFGKRRPAPAGVMVMSGFLVPPEAFAYNWNHGTSAPPVLVQHGTSDPLVPVEAGRQVAHVLAAQGAPVVYREYPMEHQVAVEELQDAAAWLDQVARGERPSEDPPPVETQPSPAAEPEPQQDDGALVKSVSSATFDTEVLSSPVPVIVDFWAPWCQPCREVEPVVEQIAAMRQGTYKVVKLNIDQAPDIAQRYQVQSIPLVALFRNGRMERRSSGAKPRPQLEAELGMLVIP